MTSEPPLPALDSPRAGLHVDLHQHAPIPLAASFSCAPGEVLALVGPSGSGKSTILRAIAGTYRPAAGRVSVNGSIWFDGERRMSVPAHQRAIGLVFQSYALFPHMTALGNVMAGMGHVPSDTRAQRARSLLALLHLDGLESRRPAELSGGQQQRVAVARALAREPQVLLLDEPFSAVDKGTRQRLYREIADLRRVLNMPVVLVTHDLDEAVMLADRMAVLDHGRTLQTGTPEDVTTRPASQAVARLIDLRNVFDGTVLRHDVEQQQTLIDWSGLTVQAALQSAVPVGARCGWVIPDGFVVLDGEQGSSTDAPRTPVPCSVAQILPFGQTAQVTLRPRHAPTLQVHLSLPLHVARRSAIAHGEAATLSLLAEGVHLLPAW